MGKSKRIKLTKEPKGVPLDQQIQGDKEVKPSGRVKTRGGQRKDGDEQYVNDKLSAKILESARKQQNDLLDECGYKDKKRSMSTSDVKALLQNISESEDEDDGGEDEGVAESYYEDLKLDENDEKAIELFMPKAPEARRNLADIITAKIREKEMEINTQLTDPNSIKTKDLDKKVIQMYEGVRYVMSKYRSGRVPKAFKIIPSLANWEQILSITDPAGWSAASMYQATRLFASNLNEKMAQRFYNLVLLPRIRDDITEFKRLNTHLYNSLKKALFKPGAFFKGIILPLCEAGDCSLREAVIVSSVLSKSSIPLLHSSAAMLMIAEMDYSGANSIFLHSLINKKYALPYRVIDALVYHFLRFTSDKRELPVLWHQCLLKFVQNYKSDISDEQKEALMDLLRVHTHHQITPVIRTELTRERTSKKDDDDDEEEELTEAQNELFK